LVGSPISSYHRLSGLLLWAIAYNFNRQGPDSNLQRVALGDSNFLFLINYRGIMVYFDPIRRVPTSRFLEYHLLSLSSDLGRSVIATIVYLFFQPSLSGNLNPKDVKQMLFCSIFIISPLIFGIASADLLNCLWEWKPSTKVSNSPIMSKKGVRSLSSLYKDPDAFALIEWLQKETPIQSPTEDLFELAVLARRIALTLLGSPLKTIVLIGPYGCGKSSIFKMVSFYLKNPDELLDYLKLDQRESVFDYESIVTCEVSAWGLHGGSAAEHILKIITRELSKYVDCLGLAGLPSNYRSAISNSASLWSKILFNFLDFHQDPIEVLHKLDTVLGCAQKRLVIFIEDLDRNPDGQVFWNEIISLLDRLKSLENVAFVLAISQERGVTEMHLRISEHIEVIPSLPKDQVKELIESFRNLCLNKYKNDIDCLSREKRDRRLGIDRSADNDHLLFSIFGDDHQEPIDTIIKLLDNPRVIKAALRRSWGTWQSLHGELDFDDLIVANVLRFGAPESFAFLSTNFRRIRGLSFRRSEEKNREKLKADWDIHIREVQWNHERVDKLIDFLFPGWIEDHSIKESVPQGVDGFKPTDYWIRLNAEDVPREEIHDQEVLTKLTIWKSLQNKPMSSNRSNLAPEILQNNDLADKVEQFGFLLNGDDIRFLASELFEHILRENGSKAREDDSGFHQLWRMALKKPVEWHEDWVLKEIHKAIPISLQFANDIYYYWRNSNENMVQIEKQTEDLRKGFIAMAKEIFENNPDALIKAIDSDYIYTIGQLVIYFSSPKGGGPGFDPQEWEWLANVLLEAGSRNPFFIIPQLTALVIDENLQTRGQTGREFKVDRVEQLFRKNLAVFMTLLTQEIDMDKFDISKKSRIQFAQQEAKKWLSAHESKNR
jgi:hypothetical protein